MLVRAALASLLLLATAVPAAVAQATGGERGGPGLRGEVVDRETRRPVGGAAVTLVPVGPGADTLSAPAPFLTDEAGRFFAGDLPGGEYRLTVASLGYFTLVDSLTFRPERGMRLRVDMVPDAVELDPLVVAAEARSRNLTRSGFYDRRRRGLGRFVDREEIEARLATRVSDLFQMMPGVRMSPMGRFGQDASILLRGGCVADVWLDGVKTTKPFPVDAILAPESLDGIEVYQASEVPARFGPSNCGAVLLWTHVPNPGEGRPWSWWRFLAAAGFAAVSFFFLR